jgi:hypothetical protein
VAPQRPHQFIDQYGSVVISTITQAESENTSFLSVALNILHIRLQLRPPIIIDRLKLILFPNFTGRYHRIIPNKVEPIFDGVS